MAITKKTTALAVADNFQIANRYEDISPELMEELKDELSDLDPENGITCRQIKVPSGGGLTFEVQGEDEGDTEPMKQINAVIVFTHRVSAYWPVAYGGGDDSAKVPVCSSMDGKSGFNLNTGEITACEGCPYNQYGSGTDDKGNPSRGKACKNMRRIYMMMDGDPNFYLLTVPPTSIKDVNKQLANILASGTPYTGVLVSFTLEKTKNSTGISYSKVQVKKSGFLPQNTAAQVVQLRNQIKQQYRNMAVTLDDYTASADRSKAPDVYPDEFEEAPPHTDDDLPFA